MPENADWIHKNLHEESISSSPPENCAQITRDNSGDISFDINHISPCISPEENAENRAKNKQLRRSGDIGDICLQHMIVITVTITQFLILWHMIANVFFLQLFTFRIFPVSIVVRPMLLFTDFFSTLNVFFSYRCIFRY